MIADHHIHTRLCRHAEGEPREYVERAIGLGMSTLGFADHLPFPAGWAPRHELPDDWSMSPAELDGCVSLVQGLAREYAGDLRILLGIEADYLEETLDETAEVLASYPFDYVIGSDAHRPQEVGRAFDQAIETAREAGYAAAVSLAGGDPEPLL
jgi:histidinol-phosphatase (PHP family)